MLVNFLNIATSGFAFGILLFLMAGGLSVTMGLMGFANMAHASFAMFGGYVTVTLMHRFDMPFLLTLPIAALATALVGIIFEIGMFRRLYSADELEQVLLTIGLAFMSIAGATFVWGAGLQSIRLPSYLGGQISVGSVGISTYRLFLIVIGGVLIAGMILGIQHTSFGAKIRAAVDNRRMTVSSGVNVNRLFTFAFALGSGLAGLGGALSVNLLSLGPTFPLRYLVLMLLVVVVGGLGSVYGTIIAALVLGIGDVVGRYYLPEVGAFIIYAIPVAILLLRPSGLFGRR